MRAYIDIENLRSFIASRENEQYKDCYEDCFRLLQRQLSIVWNFTTDSFFKDEETRKKYKETLDFLHGFSPTNRGWSEDKDTYSPKLFPARPIKSNAANQFKDIEDHSAIFLINDEKTILFKEKGLYLVGQLGEELNTIKRLFCGKDYDFNHLYNIHDSCSFPNWEQLEKDKLTLPLSDIIIMDRYIGSQEELMEYNLFKIIEVLVKNVKGEVNLVLFCNKTNSFKDKDTGKTVTKTPEWNTILDNIFNLLKEKTGFTGNVTIVFFPKEDKKNNDKPKNADHDRIIFTNYMMYTSGDSFCYYNSKGEMISSGIKLDVYSLAKKSNYDFARSFLLQAQMILEKVKELNNEDMILGKGKAKSNYLKF